MRSLIPDILNFREARWFGEELPMVLANLGFGGAAAAVFTYLELRSTVKWRYDCTPAELQACTLS